MQQEQISKFLKLLRMAQDIVVLTGAGVSTPSGLSDFKSLYNGKSLFQGYKPIDILSNYFLARNPKIFYDFIMHYFSKPCEPNVCHQFVKILEQTGKNVTVVTQNIDGLHQKAGSKKVVELHGSLNEWYCTSCNQSRTFEDIKDLNLFDCENFGCHGFFRPDVVLYGEEIKKNALNDALRSFSNADTLIVMGTSLKTSLPFELIKSVFRGYTIISMDKDFVYFPQHQSPKMRIQEPLEKACEQLNFAIKKEYATHEKQT